MLAQKFFLRNGVDGFLQELVQPKRKVVRRVGLIIALPVAHRSLREGRTVDFSAPFLWTFPPKFDFDAIFREILTSLCSGEF